MTLSCFPSGPFETNGYVYALEENTCILIDAPPQSFKTISSFIDNNHLRPTYLILTHSHWDHIADAGAFRKRYPELKIAIQARDRENLLHPGSDGLPCWIRIEGIEPDQFLEEGHEIGPFKVIETPGHTPGGICLHDEANEVLFSGDTLFKGTIGNLSFPTAQADLMWQSLKKLDKLPKTTKVYPGHGEPTTLKEESWLSSAEELFG